MQAGAGGTCFVGARIGWSYCGNVMNHFSSHPLPCRHALFASLFSWNNLGLLVFKIKQGAPWWQLWHFNTLFTLGTMVHLSDQRSLHVQPQHVVLFFIPRWHKATLLDKQINGRPRICTPVERYVNPMYSWIWMPCNIRMSFSWRRGSRVLVFHASDGLKLDQPVDVPGFWWMYMVMMIQSLALQDFRFSGAISHQQMALHFVKVNVNRRAVPSPSAFSLSLQPVCCCSICNMTSACWLCLRFSCQMAILDRRMWLALSN